MLSPPEVKAITRKKMISFGTILSKKLKLPVADMMMNVITVVIPNLINAPVLKLTFLNACFPNDVDDPNANAASTAYNAARNTLFPTLISGTLNPNVTK